jgi:hypothetical protein
MFNTTYIKITKKVYSVMSGFYINEASSFKLIDLYGTLIGLCIEVVCIGIVGFAGSR